MKNLVIFLLGVSIPSIFAFKTNFYDVRKSTAEVDQIEGVYVFIDCKPVSESDFLGSVNAGFTMSGTFPEIRSKLAHKAKKEFPTANAIVIRMGGSKFQDSKADVLLLK